MAVVINGSGTVTGLAVGGLPDGTVDAGTLATDSVTSAKITDGAITNADINASAAIAASKLSGTGKVLQVVKDDVSQSVNLGDQTVPTDIPNLSITFTPTASGNLLIVDFFLGSWSQDAANGGLKVYMSDGGTSQLMCDYVGWDNVDESYNARHIISGRYLKTSGTSSITFKPQLAGNDTGGSTLVRTHGTALMNMVVMEIEQ